MTNRRLIIIAVVMLALVPALYWRDGTFPFYDNSAQSNPLRLIVALGPFVGTLIGAALILRERRALRRQEEQAQSGGDRR